MEAALEPSNISPGASGSMTPGLFEKASFRFGSGHPADRPHGDELQTDSPLGTFLSRVLPAGHTRYFSDKLDETEQRDCSFGKDNASSSCKKHLSSKALRYNASKVIKKAAVSTRKAMPRKPSASKAAPEIAGAEGTRTLHAPKARDKRASSIDAITGLAADDAQASAVQLRKELQAKCSAEVASAAEERRKRIADKAAEVEQAAETLTSKKIFTAPATAAVTTAASDARVSAMDEIREAQQRQRSEGIEKERERQQQVAKLRKQQQEEEVREREKKQQAALLAKAKQGELEGAIARKESEVANRALTKAQQNEAKRERVRRVQLEKLEQHQQKVGLKKEQEEATALKRKEKEEAEKAAVIRKQEEVLAVGAAEGLPRAGPAFGATALTAADHGFCNPKRR